MKKILFLLIFLLLLSCSRQVTEPGTLAPALPISTKESPKENWQKIWEDTLAQAKKEGKVTLYSTLPPEVYQGLTTGFKGKTGITLEIVAGPARGGEFQLKILNEQNAGIYMADLHIAGGASLYTMLKPKGAIEPFEKHLFLPEVINPQMWYGGHLPWLDAEHFILYMGLAPSTPLVINTELVRTGEIKSFRDLLRPQFRDKILFADPTVAGQGNQWFSVYAREELLGLEFMKALAKQNPLLIRDKRLQAEWVARGKYPVSLAMGWAQFAPFVKAGTPLAHVSVEEPDYLSAASTHLVWMKNAPHPAGAKVFLNWLLSREGQLIIQRTYERQSARMDTGMEGLAGTMSFRKEGAKYYNAETEEHYRQRELYDSKAKETFGPLLK